MVCGKAELAGYMHENAAGYELEQKTEAGKN